ncbi:MAG: T9SS type A sorting domain-containing protein [Chitinophagales bacterium]
MIKKFTLSLIVLLTAVYSHAQVYTQGDVTVNVMPGAMHDSTYCASISQLMYSIVIQNSFMGDSVKVIDPSWGSVIYSDVNSSGQSPWNVNVPIFGGQMISDLDISNGMVFFFNPDTKVICGLDTVYNIISSFPFNVTNPCETGQVTGRVYADNNGNCVYDNGDVPLVGLLANTNTFYNTPGTIVSPSQGYATDINGQYTEKIISSWLDSVLISMPGYYSFVFPPTPCAPLVYQITNLPYDTADFALQCSNNLDVSVFGGTPPFVRPLVPFILSAGASNLGCASVNGDLKLVLDPNVAYNASLSSNPANSVSGDTLIWNYVNLTSLANQGYWNAFVSGVYLTPSNNVNIGDTLCFQLFTAVPANDIDAGNNYHSFCVAVVNSFDPNVKEVSPKGEGAQGLIPATTPELNYTIHFQNTGNAAAYNITIVDTLDTDLQASTLQVLGVSHAIMSPEWVQPNVVAFHFYNIMLPDSHTNEAASHGLIKFKIKPQSNLTPGTEIKNRGAIYFDNNAPVITNTVVNTIAAPNAIKENVLTLGLSVYPNPTNGAIAVNFTEDVNAGNLKVMAVDGKVVYEQTGVAGKQAYINLSEQAAGIYFIELSNKGKVGRAKVIKN